MPRGKREQADRILRPLPEAEVMLWRGGMTVPEAAKKIGVTEHIYATLREC